MDFVEVCYRSRHLHVHGVDFTHQALQFLPAHPALRGWYGDKLKEFQLFLLWEGGRAAFVLISHPKNSFTQVQSPSPAIRFLTLTESLVLPVKGGKSHFSAWTVYPKTSRCGSALT